jgi:hypothetical protein
VAGGAQGAPAVYTLDSGARCAAQATRPSDVGSKLEQRES